MSSHSEKVETAVLARFDHFAIVQMDGYQEPGVYLAAEVIREIDQVLAAAGLRAPGHLLALAILMPCAALLDFSAHRYEAQPRVSGLSGIEVP